MSLLNVISFNENVYSMMEKGIEKQIILCNNRKAQTKEKLQ